MEQMQASIEGRSEYKTVPFTRYDLGWVVLCMALLHKSGHVPVR